MIILLKFPGSFYVSIDLSYLSQLNLRNSSCSSLYNFLLQIQCAPEIVYFFLEQIFSL